jgi:agmatinase
MKNNKIFRDLLVETLEESNFVLTGIPFDENASVGKGASKCPDTFRELTGEVPPYTKDGEDITGARIFDNGNIVKKQGEDCESYFARVQKECLKMLETGKFNFFLGGDHSVAIPTERAFYEYCKKVNKIPAIIHIDAHPDICDFYDGSKYSHACPIKRAIDYGYKTSDIVLIGMRGYEGQEVVYFKQHPEIKVFNSSFINENGVEDVIKYLNEKYDDRYLVYLSYDIDANDPAYAPGTGTPEAFGLDSKDVLKIILSILKNQPVGAMDMVEISPTLDINDVTTWLGIKTLYEQLKVLLDKGVLK